MITKQAKVNTDKLYINCSTSESKKCIEKSETSNIVEIFDLIEKQKTKNAKSALKKAASKLDW